MPTAPHARWRTPLVSCIFVVVAAASSAACSGDDEGTSVLDVDETSIGTCLLFEDDVGSEVTTLPVVPCGESHTHEIFAVVESEAEVYPGFEGLEAEAQTVCFAEFEPYVGIDFFDSAFNFSWMVPTLTSWDRDNDREIICVIANLNGAPLVGSVEDARR